MKYRFLNKGFTLIEMLLVLVIISAIIFMGVNYVQQRTFNMRVDRTTTQMQQIINASLAYWVAKGAWPTQLSDLQQSPYNFLPNTPITSPWGTPYYVNQGPTSGTGGALPPVVYVWTSVQAGASTTAAANIIAGSLPLGYTTTATSTTTPPVTITPCAGNAGACTVVATANVPGQNLNNANAVTFGGVYHNGACVPAPQCPLDPMSGRIMTPEIMVVPVSVSGVNYTCSGASCPTPPNPPPGYALQPAYPINSFTAYVSNATPLAYPGSVPACSGSTNTQCYKSAQGGSPVDPGNYWRVCLNVTTENGPVHWGSDTGSSNWGYYATVLAITRCSITNENSGSTFQVWAP